MTTTVELTEEQLAWLQLAVSDAIRLAHRENDKLNLYKFNELENLILAQHGYRLDRITPTTAATR